MPSMSKSTQAVAAGFSERLVASMRTAKGILIGQGRSHSELADMTREVARSTAKGEDADDWSPEEEERRIELITLALRKVLGATAERQPHIFWQAIEVYSPQLAPALASDLAQRHEEEAEVFKGVGK